MVKVAAGFASSQIICHSTFSKNDYEETVADSDEGYEIIGKLNFIYWHGSQPIYIITISIFNFSKYFQTNKLIDLSTLYKEEIK